MSEETVKKSMFCTCVKVVTLVCVLLCSAYFVVWTYQSMERLEARVECLEGRLAAVGLMGRNKATVKRLKGDEGDWVGCWWTKVDEWQFEPNDD